MNPVSQLNDNGAAKLPRLYGAIGRAAYQAYAAITHPGDESRIAERLAKLSPVQKEAVSSLLSRQAAGVPSGEFPDSTGHGQVVTGFTQVTIIGKLPGAIDCRLNTAIPYLAANDVTGAIIKAEGQAIPCVLGDFGRATVAEKVAAAIIVASNALLEQPSAESALTARIVRAGVTACDTEFISLALNGAPAIASGANTPALLLAQVNAACAVLINAGADARFITLAANPETLLELACASTSLGTRAFPDVTAHGGTLAGLPLISSRGIEAGRIVAIAGDMVLRAPVVPRVEASQAATIEMSDAPTGEAEPGEAPVSMSQQRVSMYQTEMTAIRLVMSFGVDFANDTRAAFIDGIALAGDTTA